MNYTLQVVDDIVNMSLTGDLIGGHDTYNLLHEVDTLIEDGFILCKVDISQVRYINSSGIGLLITLLTRFRNKGGEIVICYPSESLKKLLIISKLTAIFNVAEDEDEAIVKLKSN
jgi:anti-sigma B factor antagonist